jgi:hypothetical protein
MGIEQIIGDDHHIFMIVNRTYEQSHARHMVYYKAYEHYKGPSKIMKYLKDRYNYKANQSTIYYAWYKIRNKMNEKTPSEFIKMKYGSDTVNGKGIYKLMDEYAAYQLSLHTEHPTNVKSDRLDIKNKIKELNER